MQVGCAVCIDMHKLHQNPISSLTPGRLGGFGNFRKKTAVFGCLTNALAPLPIAL